MTDSPSLVIFSGVHLPAFIRIVSCFVIFLLDLRDSTVQIPAEILDASLPADVVWRIVTLLGCVHGVEYFLQTIVGVVSLDGLVRCLQGRIEACVGLGETRLILRVVVPSWGLFKVTEMAVLGVASNLILAMIFSIFSILIAVDLCLVDIVILALGSCISVLS